MNKAAFLAVLSIAAPAAAARPTDPVVAMTDTAWGRLIAEWRIAPDGVITYTRGDDHPAVPKTQAAIETRRTAPSPARYRWVAGILGPTRRWAGRKLPCRVVMTDQDSGHVSFDRVGFDYYAGCGERDTRAVVERLFRAQRQIALWTKDAPVISTREETVR